MSVSASTCEEPQRIDILDMRNPILTSLQKAAMAAAAAKPIPLSVEAILGAARQETGLDDFGADDFLERLQQWVDCIRADDNLTEMGRARAFVICRRNAINRLRVEDLVKRHPEILEIPIERPLIVAGLPRSGTTHLQGFLAADLRLRSLPYWEAVRPVPAPDEIAAPGEEDPRRRKSAEEWSRADALMPYSKCVHEFSPDHISEDVELQMLDFTSYYLEWIVRAPLWRDAYFARDITPSYRYMKKAMQALSWLDRQKGKTTSRWLMKCPQHMEQLVPIMTVFPDATVILTHRDPVASIQSAITGMCYGARINNVRIEPEETAEYWIDRYERLLRACVRDRDRIDPAKSVDVYFDELVASPMKVIEKIYGKAGLTLPPEVRSGMEAFLGENARGKHGQLVYNLRRDFGLEPEDIRKRFRFYFDRFPVRPEVLRQS
jgi:hypothetical protein